MTRRLLVLAGTVLTIMIGTSVSASATFADSATLPTTSITTGTVDAPTRLEVKNVSCSAWTVSAMVEWQPSRAPGVRGYRVTAHLTNGQSLIMAEVGASTYEYTGQYDRAWLQNQPRFTVTTLTAYGWTAESVKSNVLTC